MYSMVLMMALTGSSDIPDFGHRGCHGCSGGCYSSRGCWGGGCWGGYGCSGGGYGCWGGYGGYGCCGGGWAGHGGRGGGYAYGGYGMPYGWAYGVPYGTMMYGGSPYQAGYYSPDTGQYEPTDRTREGDTDRRDRDRGDRDGDRRDRTPTTRPGGGVMGPAPARLIVHLPAEAQLRIDGQPTQSTSDTRVFVSPPLEPGKTYHYQLQAQLDRNGENEKTSRTVEVQAGRDTEVYLDLPTREARSR